MFEDALLESSRRRASGLRRTHYLLGYVAQLMLVGAMILSPLIYTQALPTQWLTSGIYVPAPPPGPPPGQPVGRPASPPHHATVDAFTQPPIIPPNVVTIVDAPEPPRLGPTAEGPIVPGGVYGGGSGNGYVPGGVPWGTEPPPPPPVVRAAPQQKIVQRGGDVIAAMALYQPKPVYPPLARIARIQGTVVLQAILSRNGTIEDLKVISGHPLLVQAALDAVRTWRYQPTLLNSEPVEVLTEIDVKFSLEE